jgi:CyaY protein
MLLVREYQSKQECNMTESEFLVMADSCLQQVQDMFEQAFETDVWDVDTKRSGNVLEIEFVENGSKIIVNSQAPMQEMWVAARSGGFHYKHDGEFWRNTRDSSELFAVLRSIAETQNKA